MTPEGSTSKRSTHEGSNSDSSSRTSSKTHVANAGRKRAWRPKVKTGCITCRIRKIKCDEGKPFCHRCTSTGRKCDGYSDIFRAKSASDAFMTIATVPSGADRDELRYLQFFRTYSTTELSGFFGQDTWLNSVMIASEADPAINHAIIALGALHKKFTFGGDDSDADDPHDEDSRFALQQYNLSIKHLVQAAKTGPARLYSTLTTCIIFTCFACLQSRLSDALAHLRSGLKLLAEAEADAEANPSRSPIHPVSLATLKAMLIVLDNQARLQLSEEQLREWPAQPLSTADDFGPFTTSITTMTEARDYVDRMFNRVMFLIQRVGIRASAEQVLQIETELRLLTLQINIGNNAFDTFIRSQSATLPPREQGAIAMLRVHRILIDIFLHILPLWQTHGELVWDEVEAQMSQIVTFAAIVMDSKMSRSPKKGGRKGVSGFDFGVVQPLFMVAQKCRDPALRRRALKLMLQYPCRHGLWDSYLAGRVAWEYINLEEATTIALGYRSSVQSSLDVAAEARVDRVAIEYTGAKQGEIVFWTVGDIRAGRDGVKRTVEWSCDNTGTDWWRPRISKRAVPTRKMGNPSLLASQAGGYTVEVDMDLSDAKSSGCANRHFPEPQMDSYERC